MKLAIDLRRKKSDNTYPIILRLCHFRKTTSISLGHSIPKNDWDIKNGRIKKSFKGVTSVNKLNNILDKEKVRANDIINNLFDRGEIDFLSITQIKDKIVRKNKYESFFEFGYSLVENLKIARRYGNARNYSGVLGTLKRYNKNNDLKINELNYDFLLRLERDFLAKGNAINGLASYMRTIRAIYNKAIKAGLVDRERYPFINYKIRTTPTKKRAIDLKSLRKILQLILDKNTSLFHFRNYFLASYFIYGISFIDLAFLKVENIKNGRVKYQRRKTFKQYDIKISEQLETILSFYLKNKSDNEYVFSIIKRDKPELQYLDAEWERHRYNKGLKEIARRCNIEENLTSYVSRHSFATQAMLEEVPLQVISAMLGHERLSTTQIYLKSLPTNVLDQYNDCLKID
ncbi:site-specific integrase [Aureibaculum sp. 2210JD6-5]|uniref:site-specific integrase n=1 Tax=Aureibaculum sp. 2210JD6-5 TaxID=3103957 RepID=UPI002AAE0BCD|nr:site-specific integrase [Aureibaculum sp. 2210JD6-5]MDY7396307.1 site-specific integrase [Aureibaculum sp. 2210JD6-5]